MGKPSQKGIGGTLLFGVVFDFVMRKFFPELAKELFYGPLGDWLRTFMPASASEYVEYLPVTLLFIAGIMAVTGWGMNTTVHLTRPIFRRKSKSTANLWAEREEYVPDWYIVEAMDFIAVQIGIAETHNLDKKYLEPTRLLTSKARSGEIQVWGKRIFGKDNTELSPRLIEQSDWEDIEVSIWACSPSSRRPHTQSASQRETQQFTDLNVNESQIKRIRWQSNNAFEVSQNSERKYDTPVYEAVEYVIRKIDDCDSDQCYPSARRGLRKAAFEGRIKMYGKRELKKGFHSDLRTPIPPEFWDDQELSEISTSEAYIHHEHTKAEMGTGFMRLGRERHKYWDIRVSMDEVRKEWP